MSWHLRIFYIAWLQSIIYRREFLFKDVNKSPILDIFLPKGRTNYNTFSLDRSLFQYGNFWVIKSDHFNLVLVLTLFFCNLSPTLLFHLKEFSYNPMENTEIAWWKKVNCLKWREARSFFKLILLFKWNACETYSVKLQKFILKRIKFICRAAFSKVI